MVISYSTGHHPAKVVTYLTQLKEIEQFKWIFVEQAEERKSIEREKNELNG